MHPFTELITVTFYALGYPLTGPPGIPVRELGIPGNPPFQEFPREFPEITELAAGICGNFKNFQILLIFVRDFESSLS